MSADNLDSDQAPTFCLFVCIVALRPKSTATVLPAKSDSDAMFCFQIYQGRIIDRSLVY